MTSVSGHSVGSLLARLTELTPPWRRSADTGARETRLQILDLIIGSEQPLGIDALVTATGLHPNTVRGHVELLQATGEVQRQRGPAVGRGRPPWLYTAGREHAHYERLVATLREQFDDSHDLGAIRVEAARWAAVVDEPTPADSPEAAVAAAVDALDALGFDAAVTCTGDEIAITRCPYAELVADQPVICDIHTALVDDLLGRSEQDVRVRAMEVWPRPGLCLVRLSRPDLRPARVIPGQRIAGQPAESDPQSAHRKGNP